MRSCQEISEYMEKNGCTLVESILEIEASDLDCSTESVLNQITQRLSDMEQSIKEASHGPLTPKITKNDAVKMKKYCSSHDVLSGKLTSRASEIALSVATFNASMGRIVATPTAGSCGIIPGVLFSWKEFRHEHKQTLLEGLIVAAAIGQVIANRATLAGAEGGCQAESGAAAAMASAALVWLESKDAKACFHAIAICLKSTMGLVCDPVAGLVEVPCVKRNGTLVSLAIISADMALAGIQSVIPPDEIIDAMKKVGKSIPPSLRETGRGGVAVTPTGLSITRQLNKRAPSIKKQS